MDVSLTISAQGRVSLSERGEKNERGFWERSSLLDAESDVCIDVSMDDDEPPSIRLSAYHASAEGGGRVFDTTLEVFLEQRDLELLHSYLGFLLTDRARLRPVIKPE